MVQKSAVRGRPRGFDPDKVLASVRDTFWRHGYSGTSVDQLVAATGLHKPSLYGAFGDKKRLYLAALDHYLESVRDEFGAAFALPTLNETLRRFTDRAIDLYMRGNGHGKGCFMMSTAVPEAGEDPEIVAVVRRAMDSLDRAMLRRFEKAKEDGELPPDADAEALAMIVVAHHYDLSARARAGYSREELEALADRTIRFIAEAGARAGGPRV
ncbi:MAG: TetR/AcrR family transcriptional regulator [Pseudomonadota bacterium]|nr:TetR/AcrR family transcriptional regulator [Pseudomonadota bacterium]